jgi:pimeloyl-ACP methyl ester carboxylesterase
MRKFAVFLGALAALVAVAFIALRTPDTDAVAMRAKYGGPASRFAETADGLSVHYRDQGCRDCPAIVLVHGSNASLHTFEPLVEKLGDRFRLVSYDQPGHGLTGPHPRDDYSAQGMFEALAAVVDATGIEEFAIAGNSMGGRLAWRYALASPRNLSALILINAGGAPPRPDAEKPRPYLGARIMRHPVGRLLAQHITPRSMFEQSLRDGTADDAFVTENMVDRYWELMRYPGNRRAAGLRAVADRETHYGQRLSEITVPTLIVWGAQDRVTPPYDAKTFDEMIPNSRLVIFEDVGHIAMEEAPERTAAAIDEFLDAILAGLTAPPNKGAAADVAQRVPIDVGSLFALNLGASAPVGGLCHAAERPFR